MAEEVTILKATYDSLVYEGKVLAALYAYGVDSWPDFEAALDSLVED